MGTTRLRRPPAPTGAERARSAAARTTSTAALVGTGAPVTRPLAHHVHADGSAVLVLREDDPVLGRVGDEPSVMLELADMGMFDNGRYFDVVQEVAKRSPEDLLWRITVTNHGPDHAPIHVLLWHVLPVAASAVLGVALGVLFSTRRVSPPARDRRASGGSSRSGA